MSNFTDPIKAAFGAYLAGFHAQLMGDTRGVREFAARDFSKSVVLAPGRMIDAAEDLLATWRKNDTSQGAQPTPYLPIIIVAMAKDYVATGPEYGRTGAEPVDVTIPGDPKRRVFKMQAVTADIRTQLLIAAADEPTARSIALQFHAYTNQIGNRRFAATYRLAGFDEKWPVVFEQPDVMAPSMATDQKNLTILVCDLTMRPTVPLLRAPRASEANDGQGAGANQDDPFGDRYDPSGYLVVTQALGASFPPMLGAPSMGDWDAEVINGG